MLSFILRGHMMLIWHLLEPLQKISPGWWSMCHCFYLALNRQKVAQNKDKIGEFLLHLERSHPTCSHYETSHLVDEASVSSLLKHLCCLRHSWNYTICTYQYLSMWSLTILGPSKYVNWKSPLKMTRATRSPACPWPSPFTTSNLMPRDIPSTPYSSYLSTKLSSSSSSLLTAGPPPRPSHHHKKCQLTAPPLLSFLHNSETLFRMNIHSFPF